MSSKFPKVFVFCHKKRLNRGGWRTVFRHKGAEVETHGRASLRRTIVGSSRAATKKSRRVECSKSVHLVICKEICYLSSYIVFWKMASGL
jgi:hypothetical protein